MTKPFAQWLTAAPIAPTGYLEPPRMPWPPLERRAFAAGQAAVLRYPAIHKRPDLLHLARQAVERELGKSTAVRAQFMAGARWELADLREATGPHPGERRSAQLE